METSFMGITELLEVEDSTPNFNVKKIDRNNIEEQDIELLDEIEALMRANTI